MSARDHIQGIDDEFDHHLAASAAELERSGLGADAARVEAARRFGSRAHHRRRCLTQSTEVRMIQKARMKRLVTIGLGVLCVAFAFAAGAAWSQAASLRREVEAARDAERRAHQSAADAEARARAALAAAEAATRDATLQLEARGALLSDTPESLALVRDAPIFTQLRLGRLRSSLATVPAIEFTLERRAAQLPVLERFPQGGTAPTTDAPAAAPPPEIAPPNDPATPQPDPATPPAVGGDSNETRSAQVKILGCVDRGGMYALEKGMSLASLLERAHPRSVAGSIEIKRLIGTSIIVDADAFRAGGLGDIALADGDTIHVVSRGRRGVVYVDGGINRPGVYQLPDGGPLTALRLRAAAGGIDDVLRDKPIRVVRKSADHRGEPRTLEFRMTPKEAEVFALEPDDHVLFATRNEKESGAPEAP